MQWRDTLFYGFKSKLTDEQVRYIDSIFKNQVTITDSPAGTGKTTLAVACAHLLQKPLVYLFNPVEESKLGYRPGTLEEKEADYLQPLKDALIEIGEYPDKCIQSDSINKKHEAWIEAKSHTFARGTNIKGKTVIIDEAQNFTVSDLRKILTRIHDDCTVIVIGHSGQIDLVNSKHSGFTKLISHFQDKDYVGIIQLTKNFRGRLATDADKLQ